MKIFFFTDMHLVSKTNINRIDNLPETQKNKLNEIVEICNNKNIDVALSSGDIFDRHIPAITTMNTFTNFVEELNIPFILCPGNHDLHGYNYNTLETTGLGYTCKLLKTYNKTILMKENNEFIDVKNVRIHFKETIDKHPMKELIVDKTTNEFHVGLIHDSVYNKDFFGVVTQYINFETNLDILFNGHIHKGHAPIYYKDTWFVNPGSVTRMRKSTFLPRYAICNLKGKIENWDIKNIVFKCSEKDVFNVIERNNFNDFISSIEAKKIELNALDYMFENARKSLTNDALDKLNNLYNEVR